MIHSVVTKNISVGSIIMLILFVLAGILGWFLNVINLVGMTYHGHELLLVIRVAGIIIPPLGAVVGYM